MCLLNFKLVTAAGIAESDDIIAVQGQRVGLHRLAGPGAGLVDAIVNVESGNGVSSVAGGDRLDWSGPNDAQVAQCTLEGDRIQFCPRYYQGL